MVSSELPRQLRVFLTCESTFGVGFICGIGVELVERRPYVISCSFLEVLDGTFRTADVYSADWLQLPRVGATGSPGWAANSGPGLH